MGSLGGSYDPTAPRSQNLYYYTRDAAGDSSGTERQLLPMVDVGCESMPALLDMDGDGDQDILLANKIDMAERRTSRVYWFENTGNARAAGLPDAGALPITGRITRRPPLATWMVTGAPTSCSAISARS